MATALGYPACLQGYLVLLASALDMSNTLAAAKSAGRLKPKRKKYTKPALLIMDELDSLPIDTAGADLLFKATIWCSSSDMAHLPPARGLSRC